MKHACWRISEDDAEIYYNFTRGFRSDGRFDFDSDFDFKSLAFIALCDKAGWSLPTIERSFNPATRLLIQPQDRNYYCPKCIQDDLAAQRLPSWRKAWCYSFIACCEHHACLLAPLSPQYRRDVEKSWQAFQALIPGVTRRFSCSRTSGGIVNEFLPVAYVLKVQNRIMSYTSCSDMRSDNNLNAGMQSAFEKLTRNLLAVLLSARSDQMYSGAAREEMSSGQDKIYHEIYGFEERIDRGLSSADPYHRFIALLWVGEVFGILAEDEIKVLRTAALFSGYTWFEDVYQLGYHALVCASITEYRQFCSLFEEMPESISERLSQFLAGAQAAAHRQRLFWGPMPERASPYSPIYTTYRM